MSRMGFLFGPDVGERLIFDALWEVAQDHRLEALTESGTRYAVTGDIVRHMARAAMLALVGGQPDLLKSEQK